MRITLAASFLVLFAGCLERQVWLSDDRIFQQLCGKWKLVSVSTDAGPTEFGFRFLVISRIRFDYQDEKGTIWGGTYELDPGKSPCEIDVVTTAYTEKDGKVIETHPQKMLGIYKLEGDKLTLCLDFLPTIVSLLLRESCAAPGSSERGPNPCLPDELECVRPTSFRRHLNPFGKNFGRFYTFVYQREPSSEPRPVLSVSTSRPPQ
jgi:uncharacterized protein (TIGR03067 family)